MKQPFDWSRPVAYSEERKRQFHLHARGRLRALADALKLSADSYELRSNPGGIAMSGEITLHTERVYVQVLQACVGVGWGVLVRTCKGRQDHTGGANHWLPLDALNDTATLSRYVRKVMERAP